MHTRRENEGPSLCADGSLGRLLATIARAEPEIEAEEDEKRRAAVLEVFELHH